MKKWNTAVLLVLAVGVVLLLARVLSLLPPGPELVYALVALIGLLGVLIKGILAK